jgi:hypothetical protein
MNAVPRRSKRPSLRTGWTARRTHHAPNSAAKLIGIFRINSVSHDGVAMCSSSM